MQRHYSWLWKVRFIGSISCIYVLTVGSVWYILQAAQTPRSTAHASTEIIETPPAPAKPQFVLVSGRPVRIVISDSGIDLPVDEGYYNEADGTWTLSDTHAQFAMMSILANNLSGNTFIYGHGTDQVFAQLGTRPPTVGTTALVYTDNGHIFSYAFKQVRDLAPNDTSVLSYKGPSLLTVQTCTGVVSEWRSMFEFNFEKVVQ
jgi:hypothetical protein